MAPPKNKEKITFINMRIPVSRMKQIQKATKLKGVTDPTEFCRQAAYARVDEILKAVGA